MKITAAGLIPLLLLVSLPGCVARHMPDWSKVQSVSPDTATEIQFYKEEARQRIKGRFLSATEDSVTLVLEDGQRETFQRGRVRKVLAYREFGKRWPGWMALGITMLFTPFPEGNPALLFLISAPISGAAFYGSRMGGIYEVPPEHRDWHPKGANAPAAAANDQILPQKSH